MSQLESMESYKALLVKFFQYYQPMEEQLKKFASELPLEGRMKLSLLKTDLLHLGFTETEILHLPPATIPAIPTVAEAVGAFYVLEGSTMGGQVISKQLRSKLGILPENGGSFFWAYGEKTMPMWLSFKSFLNTFTGDSAKTLESAKATFLSLEKWLC